jgi:ribose 5-phosphate isomerase A
MTIYDRALGLVPNRSVIGLGSGRAALAFVARLGERVRTGQLNVRGVPTSIETAHAAEENGIQLAELSEVNELDLTVDGADEVDSHLDLIKGYGRALVREKVVAASSRMLVILVSEEKFVTHIGSRGKLPVEVIPFAMPFCIRRLLELGLRPSLWEQNGRPGVTDNGNNILDCAIGPIPEARKLDEEIRAIPGVVGTGLFLGMAELVLVGDSHDFQLTAEYQRGD